jgi:hypothetical protein
MAASKTGAQPGARASLRFCADFSPEAAGWLERRSGALGLRVSDLLREAVENLREDEPVATDQQIAYAERIAKDLAETFPPALRASKSGCSFWIQAREERHKTLRAIRAAAREPRGNTGTKGS